MSSIQNFIAEETISSNSMYFVSARLKIHHVNDVMLSDWNIRCCKGNTVPVLISNKFYSDGGEKNSSSQKVDRCLWVEITSLDSCPPQ